ncbi:hypothetical protein V0288_05265 [Pannus brasiliensis CCIBt3594]|uniref:Uncharacterized protein n=1 Tax=Pannus brasiliensis CCIBt3594 TaxID=1427578 RepID=A0AAW9QT51_9CHRO
MQIKTITYKRIKNLGNYQSETLEMTAEIGENESPDRVTEELMRKVKTLLGIETPNPEDDRIPF